MKIILSKCIGFCSGVNRCVRLTEQLLKKHSRVYAIGQLLHNDQEMNRLKKLGLITVDNPGEIKDNSCAIIRTHGIEKSFLKKIKESNKEIIDGTCPIVKKNQRLAIEYSQKRYNIIIYGDIKHPEIKALLSYINPDVKTVIINSEEEAQKININRDSKIILIAQTTKELKKYKTIAKILKQKFNNLCVLDTICKETITRENCVKDISKSVNVVIIVGGKNSANTKKLVNIAESKVEKIFHINNVSELPLNQISTRDTIGIASGASTPIWLVEDVVKKLKSCKNLR